MAYFRRLEREATNLLELLNRGERWLICINADPDALASALALKRIMIHRVSDVAIAHVNRISRPDNLAMIRLLGIKTIPLTPNVTAQFDRFALVDSQPDHHPRFADLNFSIVMDHHPTKEDHPVVADFKDIQNGYGANATLMTEYLYNLKIRPGKRLATALLYGIKSDTMSFERNFCDVDLRAFRYLSKFSEPALLRRIVRSEFSFDWLPYFSQAFSRMRLEQGGGLNVYMDEVENPDILVILADFFLRVQEISWVIVAGVYQDKLVCIFRSHGIRYDMGKFAQRLFADLGSAGGHKSMARAEIDLKALPEGATPESHVEQRLAVTGKPPVLREPAKNSKKSTS